MASGFHGSIYATTGTNVLAGLVLLDAAKLRTEFAKRAVRRERHHHHLPRDAEAELRASGPEVTTEIDEPLYTEAARAGEAGLGRGIGVRRALEAVEDGRHGLVDRHPRAVEDEPTGVS